MTSKETFLAAFADLDRRGLAGPAWLRERRGEAIARFAEIGLPTPRDEDWKYTPLAPITATTFDVALDASDGREPSEDEIAPFCVGPASWSRLVFVNGRFSAKLSALRPLPGGVRVGSLGEALITDADVVRAHLTAGEPLDAFTALNEAFWQDGAFVDVPDGVTVEEPIHLLFVASTPGRARVDHPRNLVVLGRESRATVVESYVALAGDIYLTNAVTEVVIGPSGRLDHQEIVLESGRAFHIGRTRVSQARDSGFASCAVTLGGRLVRNEVHTILGAEGADCRLSGLYVVGGQQHVDTHTVIDHVSPRATSRQLYKGILDGRSRGVFSGRIVVRPGADGTDAHQANKNLLLSDEVEVDSKPQLEIFAADVKCGHGAADGQLPAEAIFYMKSRGLDDAAARALLTYGFAHEVLERIGVAPVRAWLDGLLTARLAGGRVTEELT
ncbi:MAG TPA: Fe-S cluster assembly protein SufD [Candidatus Acidoferrum sp.]|nr:Fe-S cluster assembly protein SufD [Candidatus Acidoferrum sp.]